MTAIHHMPTTRENPAAFRVTGKVSKEDMHEMAQVTNAAFDRYETVDILIVFDRFDGQDVGAIFDGASMKAQVRSLAKVGRYVVVGAPDSARSLIETMGQVLPVTAMTFDKGNEETAWAELGARPL